MKHIVLVCGHCHEQVGGVSFNKYGEDVCPCCDHKLILQETNIKDIYKLPFVSA